MKSRPQLFLLACIVLSACSPDAPPRLESAAQPAKEIEGELAATSQNGMLTVDPAVIDLCRHPEGLIAVDVRSDATSTGTESTEIWLESDGERKAWSGSGATFQGRTGVWLRDGSKVSLIDNRDKKELATITLTARPCPS